MEINENQKDALRILSMSTNTAGALLELLKQGESPCLTPLPIEQGRSPKACAWIEHTPDGVKVLGRTKQLHRWEVLPDGKVRLLHGDKASFAWIPKARQDLRRAKIPYFEEVAPDSKKIAALWELLFNEDSLVNAKFEDLCARMESSNEQVNRAIADFIAIPKPIWRNWIELKENLDKLTA